MLQLSSEMVFQESDGFLDSFNMDIMDSTPEMMCIFQLIKAPPLRGGALLFYPRFPSEFMCRRPSVRPSGCPHILVYNLASTVFTVEL